MITFSFLFELFRQYCKEVRLTVCEHTCHFTLGLSVGLAYFLLIENCRIELLSEVDGSLIKNVLFLLHADYMFCSTFLKDFADKLGLACSYEDKIKCRHGLLYKLLKSLLIDKITSSNIIFEEQIVHL